MPIFDRSASQSSRAEARLLRSILGPGKRRATTLQSAWRDHRRRQRRAMLKRAFLVLALGGSLVGSALMMSPSPRPIAMPAFPGHIDPVATGSTAGRPKPSRSLSEFETMNEDGRSPAH
jgi:hypothetical protein